MRLPFSPEEIQFPRRSWTANMPPAVPRIRVDPDIDRWLPTICAILANELTEQADRSVLRTFTYNLMASRDFNNTEFADMVEEFCGYLEMYFQDLRQLGVRDIESAARDYIVLLSSSMLKRYPILEEYYRHPADMDRIFSNVKTYEDLVYQIDRMRRPAPGRPDFDRPEDRPTRPRDPRAPAQTRGSAPVNKRMTFGAMTRPAEPAAPTAPATAPARTTTVPPVARAAKAPTKQPEKLITGEIETMDRTEHGIVYFGKHYEVADNTVGDQYKKMIGEHETLAKQPIEIDSPLVLKDYIAGSSLTEVLSMMRHRVDANQIHTGIYMATGVVLHPLISAVDLHPAFGNLSKYGQFVDVARRLREIIDTAKPEELRQTFGYVGQIDRLLTRLVNDYLVNGLEMKASFTSFIEDIEAVTKHLHGLDQRELSGAFNRFQKHALEHLFKHSRRQGDAFAEVNADFDDTTFVENVCMMHSITYINATSQELGYTVEKHAKRVTASSAPFMYRLINTVNRQMGRLVTVPVRNIIMTLDDARWAFYTDRRQGDEVIVTMVEA